MADVPEYIREWHDYVDREPGKHCEDIKKLKKLVEKLLKSRSVWYDDKDVQKFMKFCSFLKHKEGRWAGQPFVPSVEQRYIAACIFGFKTYDKEIKAEVRYFTELVLFVGRKWGKSTFISAIALYMLMCDGENAAQVWCLATQKTQAAIVYESAKELLRTSDVLTPEKNPRKHWRTKRDKDNCEMMLFPATNSYMKAGSKNSQTQDGLNPSCFVIDECHAIKDRNTYDVFSSAQGARSQPLGVVISTFGFVREGIFDSIFERCQRVLSGKSRERLFPMIFRIDDTDDPANSDCWIKANPGLGDRPTMRYLQQEYQKAIDDPAQMPSFLCKHLNRAANSSVIYFDLQDINKCAADMREGDYTDKYAVGGVDLAETTDLCCATAIVPIDGRLKVLQKYFIAQARLEKNSKVDKMAYGSFTRTNADDPLNRELLKVCEGAMVRKTDVTEWFVELAEKYQFTFWKIGWDRWHGGDWADDMQQNGFPKEQSNNGLGITFPVPMGARSLSQAMKETRVLFEDGIVEYSRHNGLFRWCCSNTAAAIDRNNNVQPDKASSNGRIDGYVAFLIAYIAYKRCADEFEKYQDFVMEGVECEPYKE